ncbi:MAG: hypothetical protein Ta2D_04430 [Rickettsiales bacterium]|nr:MAG: hypothetical protein Ta2D_04430 [Rickettsiales bacterium]
MLEKIANKLVIYKQKKESEASCYSQQVIDFIAVCLEKAKKHNELLEQGGNVNEIKTLIIDPLFPNRYRKKQITDNLFFLKKAEEKFSLLDSSYIRVKSFPVLVAKFNQATGNNIVYCDGFGEYANLKPQYAVVRVGDGKNTAPTGHCVAVYTENNNVFVFDTLGDTAKQNNYYGFTNAVFTSTNCQKSLMGCFENSEFLLDLIKRNNYNYAFLTKYVNIQQEITGLTDLNEFPTFSIFSLETMQDRKNFKSIILKRDDTNFSYLDQSLIARQFSHKKAEQIITRIHGAYFGHPDIHQKGIPVIYNRRLKYKKIFE